ncbi:hypothetical protein SCP_1601950 [Sparassis crispa]|uniref:Uncharacterized protein n=1 Tax=Sparassis crispa TaxID=139825 RepID=A0A401H555_9APHY|nr:hypothetical protein SCP_1601950 [Sparassis crispa]GBE89533.1 hypothetical protein SCP_1601950 [Sparassis crispa]
MPARKVISQQAVARLSASGLQTRLQVIRMTSSCVLPCIHRVGLAACERLCVISSHFYGRILLAQVSLFVQPLYADFLGKASRVRAMDLPCCIVRTLLPKRWARIQVEAQGP